MSITMRDAPLAVRNDNPVAVFQQGLERTSGALATMLPAHIPVEQFKRVALMAVQRTPDLLKADRKKLFLALQRAASDGLLPDGREGAIVMFGSDPTWMPMVAGLRKLARNSGEIVSITSQVVYAGEKFRVVLGDDERIEHERSLELAGDAAPVAVYAIAKLKGGEVIREVLTARDVEKIRNVSRAKNGSTWTVWRDEMWRKSAERRLCKHLPLSTDRPDDMRLRSAMEDASTEAVTLDHHAVPQRPEPQQAMIEAEPEGAAQDISSYVLDEPEHLDDPPANMDLTPDDVSDLDAPVEAVPSMVTTMIRSVVEKQTQAALDKMTRHPDWITAVRGLSDGDRDQLTAAMNAARTRLGAVA